MIVGEEVGRGVGEGERGGEGVVVGVSGGEAGVSVATIEMAGTVSVEISGVWLDEAIAGFLIAARAMLAIARRISALPISKARMVTVRRVADSPGFPMNVLPSGSCENPFSPSLTGKGGGGLVAMVRRG